MKHHHSIMVKKLKDKMNSFQYLFKFLIVFFLFFTCTINLQAQMVFAPEGAKWLYKNYSNAPDIEYFSVEYFGDTVVLDTFNSKVLLYKGLDENMNVITSDTLIVYLRPPNRVHIFTGSNFPTFLDFYSDDNTAFLYRDNISEYSIFSNYLSELGCIKVNQYRFMMRTIHNSNSCIVYPDTIIERLGGLNTFLFADTCQYKNHYFGRLLWYEDDEIGRINMSTAVFETCNLSVNKLNANQVNIFPNPFNNVIELTIADEAFTETEVIIFDISGKIVSKQIFEKGAAGTTINTVHLPLGYYILQLKNNYGIYRKKLVKTVY